jgi:hypothetical protein
MVFEDNFILAADDSEAAVPFLLFFEPIILSAFGAGVWEADLTPLRCAIHIFFQIYFFLLKKAYFCYHTLFKTNKQTNMSELLNINSPKFLGGQNVHNVIKIALAAFVVYKLAKK